MRLFLIAGILTAAAALFFVAVQAIESRVAVGQDQEALIALEALRSEEVAARAALEAKVADSLTTIAGFEAQQAAQIATLESVQTENVRLEGALTDALARFASAEEVAQALQLENDALEDQVKLLGEEVAQFTQNLANTEDLMVSANKTADESEAAVTALEKQLSDLQAIADGYIERIAELEDANSALVVPDAPIANIETDVRRRMATSATQDERDQPSAEPETMVAVAATPEPPVPNTLTQPDASDEIATVEEPAIVAECNARTTAVFADQQITFVDDTDAIAASSATALEALARVAVECAQNDLIVTIAVHTNEDKDAVDIIALSNGRAAALRNFLGTRGLPANSMGIMGHNAIQTTDIDDLSMGSTATFSWQQR
ncbi:hypothetical protein [Roseobacter sp. CCS2]|uniref:hypothetical protein n=1 Tax=Roseobacter sp. CCS2 TaxID=391593 RepID=UPI0000F3F729|nr:hypothetical protein [Roseobacter sp. CCS2]EBA10603.1 hypothetical protein RCCS2_03097 [Roseobacter sp. CCS2]